MAIMEVGNVTLDCCLASHTRNKLIKPIPSDKHAIQIAIVESSIISVTIIAAIIFLLR